MSRSWHSSMSRTPSHPGIRARARARPAPRRLGRAQVSNDPAVPPAPGTPSDRRLWHCWAGRPAGQRHPAWLGPRSIPGHAPYGRAGLELERVWGEGSQYCQLLLRRPRDAGVPARRLVRVGSGRARTHGEPAPAAVPRPRRRALAAVSGGRLGQRGTRAEGLKQRTALVRRPRTRRHGARRRWAAGSVSTSGAGRRSPTTAPSAARGEEVSGQRSPLQRQQFTARSIRPRRARRARAGSARWMSTLPTNTKSNVPSRSGRRRRCSGRPGARLDSQRRSLTTSQMARWRARCRAAHLR